ncbi:MAG: T9SS type A sorting domain-containing protein, partial [Flavobacteriales bacterium]
DISIIQKQYVEIKEFKENKVFVYPNPAKDIVSIESIKIVDKIVVYSAEGKMVISKNNFKSNLCSINVSHLENGVYWIRVISGETIITKKLILSK